MLMEFFHARMDLPPGSSPEDTKQARKVGETSKTNDSVGKIHIKNDESLGKGQDGV